MRRGEVWWAVLPEPGGRRPVVLVSRDASYAVRSAVTVVEVSTKARGIAAEVALGKRDGLPRACVANTDNVVTIPKAWLHEWITALAPSKLALLDEALRFALGLE